VAAIVAVELLVFDREGLLNTITRNARIALSIIDKLCRRLQAAHQKIQHLVKRDARGLIALHLLQALQQAEGAASALPYTVTLEEISLAFEMPMVDARRVLDDLALEGVLAVEGDTLRISDRARLADLADWAGAGPGTAAENRMPGGER
jgi:CRP-like cAMP-binding protein